MPTPLYTILSWFETGDFPSQQQFAASWSSFYHKDESIPMDKVENLSITLQDKVDDSVYEAHLTNAEAHTTSLAKLDASNLNELNIKAWKNILGVGSLPSNIATVDDIPNNKYGNVWSKQQSDALYMVLDQFVSDGKIMASKIEALGLTELISVTETSLSDFITNNSNYEYEKNDIIAIADSLGNYSLYIYTGADKNVQSSYIHTGLTNITIGMVQGLQAILDMKMNRPTASGNYFINQNGATSYRVINPAANYLLFWNNIDFAASEIYTNSGKYGIGTTSPGEMLHLNDGRLRTKAIVFDDNVEMLPGQITYYNRRFKGTDVTGISRNFMYADFLDYKALWQGFTDAQKTEIKTLSNGGWTTATMSVGLISPPIVDNKNNNKWIAIKGANLNINPVNFSVEIMKVDGVTVVATVPGSQVQLYTNGLDLTFYYNFSSLPLGEYKIRLWNGFAYYVTSKTIAVSNTVQYVNVGLLTWNLKTLNDNPSSYNYGSGASVQVQTDTDIQPLASNQQMIASLKSSVLVPENKDFYLEFQISDWARAANNDLVAGGNIYAGLCLNDNINSLIQNSFLYARFLNNHSWQSSNQNKYGQINVRMLNTNLVTKTGASAVGPTIPAPASANIQCIIQRVGTLYTLIMIDSDTNLLYSTTYSGTTQALAFLVQLQNNIGGHGANLTINQCYLTN